jgi:phosphoribosylglycinamide formyltransferase-1
MNDAPLFNLVVDLEPHLAESSPGIEVAPPAPADGRTLAWIDDAFGGAWSSEAFAGSNLVARRNDDPIGFATLDASAPRYAWLEGLAREPGVGIFGPIGVVPDARGRGIGTRLLRAALKALRERGYARALIPAVGKDLVEFYARACGALVAERFERGGLLRASRRTLIMASGNGSNFAAVLGAARDGSLPIAVAGLVCNDPKAYAIERASAAGLTHVDVVAWDRAAETRAAYDARLLDAAKALQPDLVLLLGWMHLLSDGFVAAFPHLINLHPAFLPLEPQRDEVTLPDGAVAPAFRGSRAVRDALAAGCRWTGATLHRVTIETDRGPVLTRKPVRVLDGEEEAQLMPRLHEIERTVVRSGVMRWLYERP